MSKLAHAADAWLVAETGGKPFSLSGNWGSARGTLTAPSAPAGFGRRLLRTRTTVVPIVALVAPQVPGLESAERIAAVDDALSAGLLRGGVHVARVREFALSTPPFDDATSYAEALSDTLAGVLALVPGARAALAGAWLGGAAAAAAAARREDLAFLVLVSAPAPEVMGRRTPENEDDPMWNTSPTLRLSDALAGLAPLEAITQHRRPVLVVNGAVDTTLASTHLEAWRAVLAYTGKPVDTVELAFADALFAPIAETGEPDESSPVSLNLLADTVARWTTRAAAPSGR
jgi:hypothetical protein